MASSRVDDWVAVVPVRDFATAKSRLRADLPARTVAAIARALAVGCVDALAGARGISRICVVSDVDLSRHFAKPLAEVVVQRPGGGLNGAVEDGLAWAARVAPESRRLVIHADLPGVTPREIEGLLAEAAGPGADAFVRDRPGTGTTALVLAPGSGRRPSFGPGSAARHAALGYAEIQLPEASGLRNDLDTLEELAAVRHWRAQELVAARG